MMKPFGLFLVLACAVPADAQNRIVIAGDSTAQDYRADRYPQSGWGSMLRCAVDRTVTIDNRAIGGRSTRSFIAQGRLDAIAAMLKPGDTLLIQFGHNDADTSKMAERFTSVPDYAANLRRFVAVARAAGAQPVLLTPVNRRDFVGRVAKPSFPAYEAAAKAVARETRTPLIDLAASSRAWLDRTGAEASKRLYLHLPANSAPAFPDGTRDDTHFSELGARGVAAIVAERLADAHLPISAHIRRDRPALARTAPAGSAACD